MMTKDYRTTCTPTGSQGFMFHSSIHPSIDLSTPEVFSVALSLHLVFIVLLSVSLVNTHIHTHTHSAHRHTLIILPQRLDRSPPVKKKNSQTVEIITSLLCL